MDNTDNQHVSDESREKSWNRGEKKKIGSNSFFPIIIVFAMLALIDISKLSATVNVLIVAQYLPYISARPFCHICIINRTFQLFKVKTLLVL